MADIPLPTLVDLHLYSISRTPLHFPRRRPSPDRSARRSLARSPRPLDLLTTTECSDGSVIFRFGVKEMESQDESERICSDPVRGAAEGSDLEMKEEIEVSDAEINGRSNAYVELGGDDRSDSCMTAEVEVTEVVDPIDAGPAMLIEVSEISDLYSGDSESLQCPVGDREIKPVDGVLQEEEIVNMNVEMEGEILEAGEGIGDVSEDGVLVEVLEEGTGDSGVTTEAGSSEVVGVESSNDSSHVVSAVTTEANSGEEMGAEEVGAESVSVSSPMIIFAKSNGSRGRRGL